MAKKGNSLKSLAFHKFWRNTTGVVSAIFILLVGLAAIFAYHISPDGTPGANRQMLELGSLSPGTSLEILRIVREEAEEPGFLGQLVSGRRDFFESIPLKHWYFENEMLCYEVFDPEENHSGFNECLPLIEVLYGVGADRISKSFTISEMQDMVVNQQIVHTTFWLGTDQFGRDMLSRLLLGSRISLSVGFIAVFISLAIGIFIGGLGGYFGGRTDDVVMWLINVIWSLPTLLLVIAITFALGKGFWQVFVAVGLTMWVEVARVIRGQLMSLREKEFVEAARALGFSNRRIMFNHLLPNVVSPLIVISAANFASAILIEAGLSFLGLGVQPPMPSWGSMLRENYAFILLDAAHLALFPGLAIMLLTLAFMLVGNALRDALDVKLPK